VPDLIPHPLETPPGSLDWLDRIDRERSRARKHIRVAPVDDVRGFEKAGLTRCIRLIRHT